MRRALAGATGRGLRVGLIDSGRDPDWQEPRILPGIGLADIERPFALERSADDADRIGHGTACCDLILRSAPEVEIVPCRVFVHRLETSVELLVAALEWAATERFDLVNLSLGTTLESAVRPFYRACEKLHRQGTIVVSAIEQSEAFSYPAAFDNVLGVHADHFADDFDYRYDPEAAAECTARGDGEVRWLEGERREVFASSFAAPRITGLLALFLEQSPGAGLAEARRFLAAQAATQSTPSPQRS
ncbi:MAG: S8 family serine peptidase [Acidobacteriota bacterium]